MRDVELASLHAEPVARLGQFYAGTKGSEVEIEVFNPYQRVLYNLEARSSFDAEVAATFLQLTAEKQVPAWVIEIVDLKLLRAAAK